MAEDFVAILGRHGVGGEMAERLGVYLELLERWGRTHNLVRHGGREELVVRHVLESLHGAGHLGGDRGLLVDVGSGAGLPGVPLLVARPRWRGILVEPRTKRWTFLRLVIRELGLEAEALGCRYDDPCLDGVRPDAVVSRALGGYGALLEWAAPRLEHGGRVVLWMGEAEAETLRSMAQWRVILSPLPDLERSVLAVLQPCFT